MSGGHRIEKLEEIHVFLERLKCYTKDDVYCTSHTFFRWNEADKLSFNCEFVKKLLFERQPCLVGIQFNGHHAVFYVFDAHQYWRVILELLPNRIDVITLYILDEYQLPRIT